MPKIARTLLAVFFVGVSLIAVLTVKAWPVSAATSGSTFVVMNTSESPPDGVWLRRSPHTADTDRVTGHGVYANDVVRLSCYAFGDAVGPGNRLWYDVTNLTRPTVPSSGAPNVGFLSAHYINDGKLANQIDDGVPACGAAPPSPTPAETVVNGKQIGTPQNAKHGWGPCLVQDFKGDPVHPWVIVSYTGGTHVVWGGMLFGWFDQGGAPGTLGCPLNDEHDAGVGVSGVVRQDFQGGSLLWAPGMNHAVKMDFRYWGAMSWALSHLGGGTNYAGWCLQFVADAFNTGEFGGKYQLQGGPYGVTARAYQWWTQYSAPTYQHPHDTNAPFGSLVFWNGPEARDGSGHIAIGLGGGYFLTTEYNGNNTVHIELIANHTDANYFGWEWPIMPSGY